METLPFVGTIDRRGEIRQRTHGEALATIVTDDGDVSLARAELLDASIRGLGLRLSQRASRGARIKLYFNGEVTPGRTGVVTHCEHADGDWVAGVACDLALAA
jgi:hypothetical protein